MNQPFAFRPLFTNASKLAVLLMTYLLSTNSISMAQVTDDVIALSAAAADAPESILDSSQSVEPDPGPRLEAPEASESAGTTTAIENVPAIDDEEIKNGLEDFQELEAPGMLVEPFEDGALPSNAPPVISPPSKTGSPPSSESSAIESAPGPYLGAFGKIVPGWGFVIKEVVPESAANRMRLEPGDVILSINGRRATSMGAIYQEVQRSNVEFGGRGLIQIDNVRGRQHQCGYRGSSPNQKRFLWLKFTL